MESLESELARARDLDVTDIADSIEAIGFECTRCGACCKSDADDPHTATVFPDEIRQLERTDEDAYDHRDVARPMPYGVTEGENGPEGETFEWALQTDACGDCVFYSEESEGDEDGVESEGGTGACTVHADRPLICETYPFSIGNVEDGQGDGDDGLGTSEPMGGVVDREGQVRAHECEGLGRDISREDAEELAGALKERAVRELEEAIGVRDNYQPTDTDGVVVHDSEGQKRPDGTALD